MRAILLSLLLATAAQAQVFTTYDPATGDVVFDVAPEVYWISFSVRDGDLSMPVLPIFDGQVTVGDPVTTIVNISPYGLSSSIYTDNRNSGNNWIDDGTRFKSKIKAPGLLLPGLEGIVGSVTSYPFTEFGRDSVECHEGGCDVTPAFFYGDHVLTVTIPEPGSLVLLSVGLVALMRIRKSNRV